MRKDNYVTAQMDCYSKEQLVRRLKYQQIEDVQNIWTARILEMSDMKRKSRTILKLEQLRYNVPLKDDEFTVAGLQREK